jgi:hypothetical protein
MAEVDDVEHDMAEVEDDVEEDIGIECKKSNRDVDEVMHDVVRHSKEELTKYVNCCFVLYVKCLCMIVLSYILLSY